MRGARARVWIGTRWGVLVAALAATGCSFRGTDHLQAEGGTGGTGGLGGGGVGGTGGTGGTGGAGGAGGTGGGPGCTDCDDDGVCDDLMTSTDHCGLCGEGCSPGPCVQGACVIAEDNGANAFMSGVATNASELFYVGTEGGVTNFFKMPLGGGSPESLLSLGGLVTVGDVFINAAEVYAAFEGPPSMAKGDKDAILDPGALAGFEAKSLSRLAGADVTVCWTIDNGARCTFDGVAQPPIDLGEQAAAVAVSNGVVYVTTVERNVYSSLVTAAMPPDMLGTVPTTGIAGIDVAQGQLYIAADDGIWTMPTAGGAAVQITTQPHATPFDLVVDQGRIFLTTIGTPSGLYRASVSGGAEELLYEAMLVPFVEARNQWVYFSSANEARIYRRRVDAVAPER